VLDAVGALDRLAHENHLFFDLDAAVAHAQSHVARLPVG
jgi:SulP family sulfate permease